MLTFTETKILFNLQLWKQKGLLLNLPKFSLVPVLGEGKEIADHAVDSTLDSATSEAYT